MSWEASAWAAKQQTGSASNKLTLLALANYADAAGICWPSQETLAKVTEQSVDTVQRRIKQLVSLGLLRVETRPARRGQWSGRIYILSIPVAEKTEPQIAAWSERASNETSPTPRHAAPGPSAVPHPARRPCRTAVRHKPSIESSLEPSAPNSMVAAAERLRAFQGKHEGIEVVQNRIARRLGDEGWAILGDMSPAQLDRITNLERRGALDDQSLTNASLDARRAAQLQPSLNFSDQRAIENESKP